MKILKLIIFISLAIVACDDKDDDILTECDQDVIIDEIRFQNDTSDMLSIQDITLEDNCMEIEYSSSGCDGETWITELIASESVINTDTTITTREVYLFLENIEECDAVIIKTESFDISEMQVDSLDRIDIIVKEYDERIQYNY